uniref:Uncharacterized protein n=1 Tax=Arundo donax TaxID=35708 RepID=A0A0A9DYJ1_ARUDO
MMPITRESNVAGESFWKRTFPVQSSASIHPSDHISISLS